MSDELYELLKDLVELVYGVQYFKNGKWHRRRPRKQRTGQP